MSLKRLQTIFALSAGWAQEFDFACRKGCATCCTQSVSMTMLEGELIHAYLTTEKPELLARMDDLPPVTQSPLTTNQFAAACLRGEEIEEGPDPWNMSPCFFLADNYCAIYPVRPFMCRSFGSRIPCDRNGAAEIDPLFLTLNTIVIQCIEHLDRGRPWGNMNTILRLIDRRRSGRPAGRTDDFQIAEPLPGFLVPPEEADLLRERVRQLLDIVTAPS